MSGRLTAIWRHPVKGLGREALDSCELGAGTTLPWDRAWAVAHEAARLDGGNWVPCANFARGAKAPALMAVTARFDPETRLVSLAHPDREEITFDPDGDVAALIDWLRPLIPEGRAAPSQVVRAAGPGFTDSAFPSISIANAASLRALSQRAGRTLAPHRFRANLWIDGLAPWEELDLVGQSLHVGDAVLDVREPIDRCRATHVDPETGFVDTDILGLLESGYGNIRFGVYATVRQGGRIARGDLVSVLP